MSEALSIWERRRQLEKERREHSKVVMAEFDKIHYAKLVELQKECGGTTLHNYRFTHTGPIGHPWFCCTYCGATKVGEP